jgi:hypothetical protein
VLLARLHNTGELLLLAEDLARRAPEAARGAPDRALDFLLAGLDGSTTAADEAALGVDALRRASMLMEGIEGQPIQRPSRAAKLKWVRRRLDAICRGRVEAAVASLGRAGPAEPSSSSSSSSAAACAQALARLRESPQRPKGMVWVGRGRQGRGVAAAASCRRFAAGGLRLM